MSIISNVRIGTFCSLLFFCRNLPGVDLCGGYQNGATGMISFPESVLNYPNKTDCTWYVTAPYNADSFLLTFSRFDINDKRSYNQKKERTECDDYLQILRADDSTMMHRCGKLGIGHGLQKIEVRGNSITVHFHSDNINTGKGFSFTWKALFQSLVKSNRGLKLNLLMNNLVQMTRRHNALVVSVLLTLNKWRSTTPQPTTTTTPQPTTTTTPQPTTTTSPQTITTTTPQTITPQTTTPQTTTTTTPQPTTTTTTIPQPTTATTTTLQPTTTKPTTTATSTTPQPTTTTETTTTPQPTVAKNTLTTTSTKEALTTTASATTCVPATFVENSTTTQVANCASNEDTPGALILGYAAFSISLIINIITCFFLQRRVDKREETYMSPICRPQAPVQPSNYESLSLYDDVIAQNMTRMYSEVRYEEPHKTIQTYPLKKFSKESNKEAQMCKGTGNLRLGRMEASVDILQSPEMDNPQTEQRDAEYIEITM